MRAEGTFVVLREKRLSDAENDYAWSTDPELSRLDAAQPLSMSFRDARTLWEEEMLYPPPRRRRFGIETKDGVHIGNCMVYDIDEGKGQCEMGIMIGDRRYWNRAYGTDAVETLLRHLFTEGGMRRVYLHTLEWNVRARRAFQKAGFLAVGRVRRNAFDFIAMEITKERWQEREVREASTPAPASGAARPGRTNRRGL